MADMKFPCPQCGQHISCGETWAGRQIECPACHNRIVVPQVQAPSAPSPAALPMTEPSKPAGAKLAPGVTQVPRSTAHAPAPAKRFIPQRHGSENSLLKYGVMVAVVAVLAAVGYFYGLPLITGALQREPAANSPGGAKTSQSGGTMGGPMGDVNGAMDVSETLDAGSSPAKTHRAPSTNNTARLQPVAPRQ
jgi:DNA-directed RNA polymerase subunit RPC12/RpoP